MGISEAISRGMDYCHRQSLQCRLRDAHLSDGVWKLRYATTTPTETGELDLELDARTRQLLRARQRGVGQHPGGH